MLALRSSSRLLFLLAFVATFWAGFYFHSTPLPAQSQQYFHSVLEKAGVRKGPNVPADNIEYTEDKAIVGGFTQGIAPVDESSKPADEPVAISTPPKGDGSPSVDGSGYTPDKWFFQAEVDNVLPTFDVAKLRSYSPRNYKGPGHEAFATFYLSRNASLHDPYYLSTMQVIYRLLWEQNSRSKKYPVVVFVAPFVTDEQRSYFAASGALVREVESRPFVPNKDTKTPVAERLKDVFSKLEMWNATDFSRIAYLDSDAFPLMNIDLLLTDELVADQKCREDRLPAADRQYASDFCDYAFGAVKEEGTDMMNAGVMVLKPNEAMHSILLREYQDGHNFDNGFVEQALLTYIFREDGPFPPTVLSRSWNGAPRVRDEGDPLFIVHGKLWALYFKVDHWATTLWEDTWNDLLQLYQSTGFETIRAKDDARAKPHTQDADISKWHLDD